MSFIGKRNAEEAFGKDGVVTSSGPSRKKNRQARREHKQWNQVQKVQHNQEGSTEISTLSHTNEKSKKNDSATRDGPQPPRVAKDQVSSFEQLPLNKPKDQSLRAASIKKSRFKTNKKSRSENDNSLVDIAALGGGERSNKHQEVQIVDLPREETEVLAAKQRRKNEQEAPHQQKNSNMWSVARPCGGVFIDHDPILAADEEYLILATKQDIQVYATKTSLLVRTLHVTRRSEIITYAQITTQDQFIVVGLKDGSLLKYDWTTGQKVWSASFRGCISSIVSTSSNPDSDAFLMINLSADRSFNMTSVSLDKHGKGLGRKHMMSQKNLLQRIVFSADLGIAIVCSRDTIYVGRLGNNDKSNETPFYWQEISVVGRIASFDAEIKRDSHRQEQPLINIAVGLNSGEIQVYDDVLEATKSLKENHLRPRRLHWHRTAPRAVKFSPDSNYLISGGDETVLVIWQLLTNQKQTLPHLTTAILNATVSRQGSAYALRLADNSIMVLSTSDLQPFADVSNLVMPSSSNIPFLPGLSVPAVLHPIHSDRLLLAYSLHSLNPSTGSSEKSINMLQTFDIASQLQLSRQALARNLATTVNIDPSGEFLKGPDCTHLDITHDGRWLVTVDQWKPSESNLKEMYLSRGDQSSREQMNECYLRFWSTNQSAQISTSNTWELNTRIDEPFATNEMVSGGHVLAISVNPVKIQVAVLDSGRHLRVYSPKVRIRSGVPIRNANGQQLFTWTCDHDISLQEASTVAAPTSAAVAFSEDGSVLAAFWASASSRKSRLHLVDSSSACVVASLPNMVSGNRCLLAFCRQYLMALSDRFSVYDIVTMQQTIDIDIDSKFDRTKSRMAVNARSGTVALAFSDKDMKTASQLLLLDSQAFNKPPVLDEKISAQVHVLLAERDAGGFVVVDGQGRTIRISSLGSLGTALIPEKQVLEKENSKNGLHDVFGKSSVPKVIPVAQEADSVQPASLESVFSFESTAQAPGARDLFNQIALVVLGAVA